MPDYIGFFRKKVGMDVKDTRGRGIKDSSELIKALIKSFKNKHLNPRILESWNPV